MYLRKFATFLIILGIVFLGWSLFTGEAHFALFIVFPVIYGSGLFSAVGIFLIMIGIFLFFISPFEDLSHKEYSENVTYYPEYKEENVTTERKTKYGGVILIGPIPIVFGSDKDMAKISVLIGILMLIGIALFYLFYIYHG